MSADRIPNLTAETLEGVALWFANMEGAGLSFHPEDDPAEILGRDGGFLFTREECSKVRDIQDQYFAVTSDPCAVARAVWDALEHIAGRNACSAGPVVWAACNPDEARELAEFAEEFPETFAAIGG